MLRIRFILGMVFVAAVVSAGIVSAAPLALTNEEKLAIMPEECTDRMRILLMEEVNLYREAQFGPSPRSVLNTVAANTSDLVPYLVQNYHALDCRLHLVCDAIASSQRGDISASMVIAHEPLGCSRLFAARGRWWSADRQNETFRVQPIPECAYDSFASVSYDLLPSAYLAEEECNAWSQEVLHEERQMLRLIVAQDAAERGMRRIVPVFQNVLADIRESFLVPLRGMIDLFGSVIHPIPCLLRHCN